MFEPTSKSSDAPLKYAAGMVLSVPVDCELYHLKETQIESIRYWLFNIGPGKI